MFNKILARLKNSKLDGLRDSLSQSQSSNKRSPFKLSKTSQPNLLRLFRFSNRFSSLRALRSRLLNHLVATNLRAYTNKIRSSINGKMALGSSLFLIVSLIGYQYNPWLTKIVLHYEPNEYNKQLVSRLAELYNTNFYPSIMCLNPLLQSAMHTYSHPVIVKYFREPLLLSDGGQVTLDWALPVKRIDYTGTPVQGKYYPYNPPNDNKIMFIIHGLTGGSETNYIQALVDNARKKGYRVVVMNHRGVNQQLLTPLPYHGGFLQDFKDALNHVRETYPNAPIVSIGTSFGGNQLVRYLGEAGNKSEITAGVALSSPFDMESCMEAIENTVYENFFVKKYLEQNFLPNYDVYTPLTNSHGIDLDAVLRVKSIRAFHEMFTVKLYNHKDCAEYFATTKIEDSHIESVKVPLLMLHARDDPIAPFKAVPVEKLEKNPNIILAETNRGGHLCWFTGIRPKRWYAQPTVEFLEKVLELNSKEKNKPNVVAAIA